MNETEETAASHSIDDIRLSASGLSKLDCPRRWAMYYLEKRPDEAGSAAALGTFAHEALEEFYALTPVDRTLDALRDISTTRWDAFAEMYAKDHNDGTEVTTEQTMAIKSEIWNGLSNIFDMEHPPEVDVHSVEMKVEANFEGIPYIGFVDRIDYRGGDLSIVDYKGGNLPKVKFMGDKLMQLMLYGWALDQMGVKAERAELYYIKGKMVVATAINSESDYAVKAYLDKAVRSIQNFMDQDEFPPKTSPLCGWCPYITDCDEGEEFVLSMRKFGRMRADAPGLALLSERDREKPGSPQSLVDLFWEVK